ncbi:MAG: D-alanyl-D-alanine carboxypeptidase family protein [Chlamydiales bacterium]|nr:D-alanyl-D-alanine carboxypeptidase family protein [Chlamydiales bacterium]
MIETRWDEHPIIAKQYACKDAMPTIVDERIKSITIVECHEALVDVYEQKNRRIEMLPSPVKPFGSPDCNSGLPSASKMRKKVFECLEFMLVQLDELAPSFGYTKGTVSIKVFEGLRDLETQKTLFNNKLQEIQAANPDLSVEEAEKETCKWISPVTNNIPVHSTGAAVDIRLWDMAKDAFLDMGPFGAIWGKNDTAPTFSEALTTEQKNNRHYMLLAAAKADLTNYPYEFWHFSHGDRYAAFWKHDTHAKYGAQ